MPDWAIPTGDSEVDLVGERPARVRKNGQRQGLELMRLGVVSVQTNRSKDRRHREPEP